MLDKNKPYEVAIQVGICSTRKERFRSQEAAETWAFARLEQAAANAMEELARGLPERPVVEIAGPDGPDPMYLS